METEDQEKDWGPVIASLKTALDACRVQATREEVKAYINWGLWNGQSNSVAASLTLVLMLRRGMVAPGEALAQQCKPQGPVVYSRIEEQGALFARRWEKLKAMPDSNMKDAVIRTIAWDLAGDFQEWRNLPSRI